MICFIGVFPQEALNVLEFTEEEIRDMFKLLSGVLQLGNIEFMTAGGAQITTKQGQGGSVGTQVFTDCRSVTHLCSTVVTNASELLGLDAFQLNEVLTQRSIILRGEEICSPLTIEQVSQSFFNLLPLRSFLSFNCKVTLLLCFFPFSCRPLTPGTLWPWHYIPSVSHGSS